MSTAEEFDPMGPAPKPPWRPTVVSGDAAIGERLPMCRIDSPGQAATWLKTEVGTNTLAGMFRRGAELVHCPRIGHAGYVASKGEGDDDGPAQVRRMTPDTLASRVQYSYWVYKVKNDPTTGAKVPVDTLFPPEAARPACQAVDLLPNVRMLRGVVHSPIVRADGSILSEPGYDEATALLYLPDPALVVPPVAQNPTAEDVKRAVALLAEMVAGFNFLTPSDRANYFGLLLTPLLREIAPAPYKLGAIGAPQPGSGKTLLATLLRIIHGGVFRSEMPEDDAELRKSITTILDVTTGPVVHHDNVSGVLRSSTLAGLLTSPLWEDRRLGGNTMMSAPNDRLWVITGNNLTLGGDLVRRTVWVTIDPAVPDPHLRTGFAIEDLEGWARARRGELLGALLTLVRSWAAAGAPVERKGSDSYARWIGVVDGILRHAGAEGRFDDSATAQQEIGVDDSDWREFLEPVRDVFGAGTWTVKDLLAKVHDGRTDEDPRNHVKTDLGPVIRSLQYNTEHPLPLEILPQELVAKAVQARGNFGSISKSLGRYLMNRRGRWAGRMRVVEAGVESRSKSKLWQVQTVEEVAAKRATDRDGV